MPKEHLKQQLHKNCGGEIIIASDKTREGFLGCKNCCAQWEPSVPLYLPSDFENLPKHSARTIKPKK